MALFILVIGGFLGVTMKTGAIQAGIARVVERCRAGSDWMIPILMAIFAIGGTTYGMAEESLAFYALIITVMIAAGYDALVGAAILLLGCGIGVLGLDDQPVRHRHRLRFAGVGISEGLIGRAGDPGRRHGDRHLVRDALRRAGEGRPEPSRWSTT